MSYAYSFILPKQSFIFFCWYGMLFIGLSYVIYYATPPTLDAHLEIDSTGYHAKAVRFATTNILTSQEERADGPITAAGYPLILGLLYKAHGSSNYKIAIIFNIILALLLGYFICLISQNLFGTATALMAGFLWSINVGFLTYCQFLLNELIFILMLTLFIWSFICFLQSKNLFYLIISSIILGTSIVIKGAALLFLPIVLCLCLFINKHSFVQSSFYSLVFFIGFLLPVFGYMAFNAHQYGFFRISAHGQENMYNYYLPRLIEHIEDISYQEACAKVNTLQPPVGSHRFESRYWQAKHNYLKEIIIEHPGLALWVWAKNVLKTCFGLFVVPLKVLLYPDLKGGKISFFLVKKTMFDNVMQYVFCASELLLVRIVSALEVIYNFLRLFFIIGALITIFQQQRYVLVSFFISYISYFLLLTGHDGTGRYRLMIEPVLIILTAYGIILFYNALRQKIIIRNNQLV